MRNSEYGMWNRWRAHVVLVLVTQLSCVSALPLTLFAAEKVWTRSAILAIADAEARRLGYNAEYMSVSFDWLNSPWQRYLGSLKGVGGMPNLEAKLKGQQYIAVYLSAMKERRDHEQLWVFIDRNSGAVIDTIPGE